MSIEYVCRHCRSVLGTLDESSLTEAQLGFHFLTPEERQDIISYNYDGGMVVRITCEYCSEALKSNPELSLLNPLQ